MTDPIPKGIIGGRIYHKPRSRCYAYGCNPEAIRRAARQKYDGIDLDMRSNKHGRGWCFHQANPTRRDGWEDPAGIVTDATPLTLMGDVDCERLRYGDQPAMSVRAAVLHCKAAGIIPCFEDKTFAGHSVQFWREIRSLAADVGVTPVIMSLPGTSSIAGTRKLAAAHEAGMVTLWLWRPGSRIPPFVDLVKSHAGRPIYAQGTPSAEPKKPPRRPVRFPWRRFSLRWKRRHPSLWRRIVSWRRRNPRRNR